MKARLLPTKDRFGPMMDNPLPGVQCLPDAEEPIASNTGGAAANTDGLPTDKE